MIFCSKNCIKRAIAINLRDGLREKLETKGIHFDIEDRALELIIKEGYDPAMGARPLKRTIERLIVMPLSEKLLKNEFTGKDLITVDAEGEEIVFKKGDCAANKTRSVF